MRARPSSQPAQGADDRRARANPSTSGARDAGRHEALSGRARQRPHRPRRPAGRDPRAARRERRRQVDPHEHPLRPGRARTRARSSWTASPSRSTARPTPSIAASAWSTSTSCWSRSSASRRTSSSATSRWPIPIFLDRKSAHARIRELGDKFGFEVDPDAKVGIPLGRLAATRRDPQGALSQREHPGPRRADCRAHAAGDARDLRRPPPAHEGARHVGDLHQPQAVRGAGDRRPDHRHPARQGRRCAHPVRDERGGPCRADGGPRRPAHRRSWREPPRPT